jgi:dolichol-phosphate mannosyltransferase
MLKSGENGTTIYVGGAAEMNKISVVIPVYNEEKGIRGNLREILETLRAFDFESEVIVVDDGSRDGTWAALKEFGEIRALRFSRNFGKEAAMFAGLDAATGDAVAIMDADLQHPPAALGEMAAKWREGARVVEAVKNSRGKESALSRLFANCFYRVLAKLSGVDLRNMSDFRLLDRTVVDALLAMPERQTFFRAMSAWVGFERARVYFDVPPRAGGKSKFSRRKLIQLAVSAICSFSAAPLQIVTVCGGLFLLFALVMLAQTLYMYAAGRAQSGFTTVILLILLVGSILMLSVGILGVYVAKIYDEVKARPRYLIAERRGEKLP